MAASESLCRRCAASGPTCCQRAWVYVTPGDVRRIGAAAGVTDFWERRWAAPDQMPEPGIDPAWAAVFAADSARPVLKHGANGDCVFLGPAGCRLALDARPLVCRLYPYDYTDKGLKGVNAHLCPAEARENGALALALLGMNRDAAEAWRRQLYAEIAAAVCPD